MIQRRPSRSRPPTVAGPGLAGERIRVAAIHRQLRAQPMGDGSAHFRLLSSRTRAPATRVPARPRRILLAVHLQTWQRVLADVSPDHHSILEISAWNWVLAERVNDVVRPRPSVGTTMSSGDGTGAKLVRAGTARPGLRPRRVPPRTDRSRWATAGSPIGPLRCNRKHKERCLVSCVSTERLLALTEG